MLEAEFGVAGLVGCPVTDELEGTVSRDDDCEGIGEPRTYALPFAVFPVPHVYARSIRQVRPELRVERKQRDLSALEPLPRAVGPSACAACRGAQKAC